MANRLYLDHAASAPIDPAVAEAVGRVAALTGNPSSVHAEGRALRAEIDRARVSVAKLLGADPSELTFTSGATESNAMAVIGMYRAAAGSGRRMRILRSPFEHPSVSAACAQLEEEGAIIDILPAKEGVVDGEDVKAMLKEDTVIVSVMWVNNVIGSVQPVADIGAAVAGARKQRGPRGNPLWFFSDAVQAVGTMEVIPRSAGVDALTLSSHKICGPKGVGGLYVRKGVPIVALVAGGGQENGVRGGTEHVAGIAGFGAAAGSLSSRRTEDAAHVAALRARLVAGIAERVPGLVAYDPDMRRSSPHVLYAVPLGSDGETLAMRLDAEGIAVSTGSACESGKRGVDAAVLSAFGAVRGRRGGIRISFGRSTTEADIDRVVGALTRLVA